ncbi:O-antigen ligase family protein [Aureimonas populi]|uniref:O-antigen ligase family protein n=1 Tax=Aureimonas populi TaxID=1701758 RepID=A0ABW5CJW5_9HYPH|nr:O-antigen ligase family protein [Aureimonas populi]
MKLFLFAEKFFWSIFFFGAFQATAFISYFFGGIPFEILIWLTGYLFALTVLVFFPREFSDTIVRNAFFLLWPAVAILSYQWSLQPGLSLYHGFQLAMTVLVALAISQRLALPDLLKAIFWTLLAAQFLSLAAAFLSLPFAFYKFGEWRGIFAHKNVLGQQMTILFYTSLILFSMGWRRKLTTLAMVLAVFLVVRSQSATSLLAVLVSTGLFSILIIRRAQPVMAGLYVSMAMVAICGVVFLLALSGTDLVSGALAGLGKDSTLTGRRVLWDFAEASFAENPILGVGFKAYWEVPAISSYVRQVIGQELWHFHNNYLEVAVAFGLIGLVVFLSVIALVVVRTIGNFIRDPAIEAIWPVMFMAHLLIQTLVENPLFVNHAPMQLLFVIVGAKVTASREAARNARAGSAAAFAGPYRGLSLPPGLVAQPGPLARRGF